MAKEHISNFLNNFSISFPMQQKINFLITSPNTLIYVAHIEGTPIEETVETAKKIYSRVYTNATFQQNY